MQVQLGRQAKTLEIAHCLRLQHACRALADLNVDEHEAVVDRKSSDLLNGDYLALA